jgi:phospholipase/lecithinase/hemolysin
MVALLTSITALTALATTVSANWPVTVTHTKSIYKTSWKTKTETKTVTASCHSSGIVTYPSGPSTKTHSSPSSSPTSSWPGWKGISHLIVFGDSYTTTGFNDTLAQPSEANPLGNPAYPGYTATNGPNWVDFLTTTYNQTFIETINLAYGGATVDSALVTPYLPTVLSLKEQIEDEYLPVYSDHPSFFDWQADDTLFAIFIGINDVGNAYGESNATAVLSLVIKEYASLVDVLYKSGARNFLFLNVPPVDRSPLTVAQGAAAAALEHTTIAAYNANVTALARNLSSTYRDAFTSVFDTNAAFTQVLNNPASHPETAPYKNTTDYCVAYENGTPSWYTFYQNCSIPVDEYFWLNSLHPTFRMMNVTAQEIVQQLS